VGPAPHHLRHRLLRRRHHDGEADLRAHLPPRRHHRRLHRRRRVPPLRPGRDAPRRGRRRGLRQPALQPLRPGSEPAARTRSGVRRVRARRQRPHPPLRPRRARGGVVRHAPRHLHRVGVLRARHRPAVLRGPPRRGGDRHGRRRAPRRPQDRRGAGDQFGVDAEDPPRQGGARLQHRGGDGHHPPPDAGLHPLHLPAVHRNRRELPTRADGGHLEPFRGAVDTDGRRVDGGDPLQEPARHRLRLPGLDAPRQLDVAGEHHRHPRRQARPGDAAHLDADDPATHRPQAARVV
ncbi:MAG: Phosphoribulokinase, partial [uncultured Acetobacteraceae bacterium]